MALRRHAVGASDVRFRGVDRTWRASTATSGFASVDLDKNQRVWVPVVDYRCEPIALAHAREVPMSDDPADVINAAIRSAFVSYPKEDDPDWRSPSWIMPKECAQLTNVIMRELEANGFQIVKKAT
jgi:hypothetical protein